MAVIKEYEQQFGVREYGGGRRAGGEDFGFAQGISDLARGISAGADAMQRYEANKELSDAQVKVVEAQGTLQEDMRMLQETAQPGVSTAIQAKARTSELFKKMQDNYKTPAAKQYIALHGAKMTNSAVNISTAFDIDLSVKDKFAKQDVIFKNVKDKVFANPNLFNEAIDPLMNEITNGIGVWDVPGGEKTKIAMRARVEKEINDIAYAAGLGAIEKSIPFRTAMASLVPTTQGSILNSVMTREGGFVANDAGRGATNYGINGQANGLTEDQVKSLTKEGAAEIYKKNYWDKYGVGNLPQQTQAVVFDGVVNHRSDFAVQLVDAAKGGATAEQLGQMRLQEYQRLIQADPTKYAKYEKSWTKRVNDSVSEKPSEQQATIPAVVEGAPWYESLTAQQKVTLLHQAEQKQRKEQAVADKARDSVIADQDAYFSRTLKMPDSVISSNTFSNPAERQAYESKVSAQRLVQNVADEPYSVQIAALEKARPQIDSGQEPGVYAKQEQVYREAQKIIVEANKKRNENPIGIAYERSFSSDNPIQPIEDVSDAAKMIETLKIRAPQAKAVNQTYGTGKDWMLMKNEAENIQRLFSTMNFQGRAEYLETLRDGLSKDDYNSIVGQVWKDNKAIASAGHLLSKPMDARVNGVNAQTVAETMLAGEQAMNRAFGKGDTDEEKAFSKALIPSKPEARALVGEVLKGVQVSPTDFDSMSEAVLAHYIGSKIKLEGGGANTTLSGADTVATANRRLFKTSVETVLGTPSNINGKVLRPWGMDDAEFKDRVNVQIRSSYPDMEDAGLLATDKEGRYELVVGGVPTKQFIDVLRGSENYGTEGFKRPFVPNDKQQRVATAVREQASILEQITGGTLNRGGAVTTPTSQQVYADVGVTLPSVSYGDVNK